MPVGNEVVEQRSVGGRVVALEKSAADITLQYEKYVDALDIKKHRPYPYHYIVAIYQFFLFQKCFDCKAKDCITGQ